MHSKNNIIIIIHSIFSRANGVRICAISLVSLYVQHSEPTADMMDVQMQRLYKKSMWNGIIAILALFCMDDLQFYSGWKTLLQFFQDEGQNKGSGDERCILSTEKCRMISLLCSAI